MSGMRDLAKDLFSGMKPEQPEGTVFGKYILRRELGRGGAGTVHLAWDRELHRDVALKFIEGDAEPRFEREARAAAALDHPNIVRIYGFGTLEGKRFLELQYISGQPLSAWAPARPIRERVELLRKIAAAVGYAHQRGVIHRDLKSSNILVDDRGEPCLIDFGLAAVLDQRTRLTRTGDVMGTPSYLAPEQARGEPGDVCTDVYALGVILYELLTGRLPFEATTLEQLLARILKTDPARPRRLNAKIHPDLETICLRATDKEARLRYPSAEEFEADLARFLAGEPIGTRPPGFARRTLRRIRRRPLPWIAAGLVALCVAAAGTFALSARRDRTRADEAISSKERREQATRLLHEAWPVILESRRELYKAKPNLSWYRSRRAAGIQTLSLAIQTDPTYAEPRYLRGRALLGDDRWAEAEEDLREAVRLEGTHSRAWSALGLLFLTRYTLGLGSERPDEEVLRRLKPLLDRAQEAFAHMSPTSTVGIDDWVDAQEVEALRLHFVRHDTPAALKVLDRALAEYESEMLLYWKGVLSDAHEERARCFEAAANAMPGFAQAWAAFGSERCVLGNLKGAKEAYDQALALSPEVAIFQNNAGAILQRLGQPERALEHLDRAVRLDASYVDAWINRAIADDDLGRLDAALEDSNRALALDENNSRAYLVRGSVYLTKQAFGECIAAYTRALEKNPRCIEALVNRSTARTQKCEYAQAREDLDLALNLEPKNTLALDKRAFVLWKLGDTRGAVADWKRAIEIDPSLRAALERKIQAVLEQ